MKKIQILSLDDCDKCQKYKDLLRGSMLEYINISCNDSSNSKFCDSVENIISCDLYPITIVDNKYIVSLTMDYQKLSGVTTVDNQFIMYAHSINNMHNIVMNLLHL